MDPEYWSILGRMHYQRLASYWLASVVDEGNSNRRRVELDIYGPTITSHLYVSSMCALHPSVGPVRSLAAMSPWRAINWAAPKPDAQG